MLLEYRKAYIPFQFSIGIKMHTSVMAPSKATPLKEAIK